MSEIDKILDKDLMNEMLTYNPIEFRTIKAAKVWMNCIRVGKFKLAQKIENKWAKPKRYDIVEAFKYSLMAFSHQQSKNATK